MRVPLQIAFHGVDHSDAAEESIRSAVAKLERIDDRIMACRVAIEGRSRGAEKHHKAIGIRIDLTLPGVELVVTEAPEQSAQHDMRVTLRRAFASMERRLKEHRERARV